MATEGSAGPTGDEPYGVSISVRPVLPPRRSRLPRFGQKAAVAVVGLFVAGVVGSSLAGQAERAPAPPTAPSVTSASPSPRIPTLNAHLPGLSLAYPASWKAVTLGGRNGQSIDVLGSVDGLEACRTKLSAIDCARRVGLGPGGGLVIISVQKPLFGTVFDVQPVGGWTSTTDRMPTAMTQAGPSSLDGAEESERWVIAIPGSVEDIYSIEAYLRGPDLDTSRGEVANLVGSIRFDAHPPPLQTPPLSEWTLPALAERVLDTVDREAREYRHTTMYGCFPRRPGAATTTLLRDGPDGRLPTAHEVRCSTDVAGTDLDLWQMTLTVAWSSSPDDYSAGQHVERVWFTADGKIVGSQASREEFPDSSVAPPVQSAGDLAALRPGDVVDILAPGGMIAAAPSLDADALSWPYADQHLAVVAGPIVGDRRWYGVQWQASRSGPPYVGWAALGQPDGPVFRRIVPRCPGGAIGLGEVIELVPAERLQCFGNRELTFSPVVVFGGPGIGIFPGTGPARPAVVLAEETGLEMYDSAGPQGVDGHLSVHYWGGQLPTGRWLSVTGHFDDPASAACAALLPRADPIGPSLYEGPERLLDCRERFVVTRFRPMVAPADGPDLALPAPSDPALP